MMSDGHKTVLITGGAKRIGRGLTERLAQEGWAVAIHCHTSDEDAEGLAHSIREQGGIAEIFTADLNNTENTERLVPAVAQALGPITALINNASIFEEESWNDVTAESWSKHLNINLHAPFLLSQTFARELPEDTEGAIINIIDQRVLNLTPNFLSYTVSKSGLWALTRTMAMALAPRIRVNGVGPGPTLPNARQTEQSFQNQAQATPLGRKVDVKDIADAVSYLLSAKAVTGQMISVDSGEHLGWAQPIEGQTFDG